MNIAMEEEEDEDDEDDSILLPWKITKIDVPFAPSPTRDQVRKDKDK